MTDAQLRLFMAKVDMVESGCWLWTASLCGAGYARFGKDLPSRAHIRAYNHYVGPVPEGLELDHLCRVRRCVNPEHLEPVTHQENHRRAPLAQRTHCANGHPFDERNTRWEGNKRRCRACGRDRLARWQERQ